MPIHKIELTGHQSAWGIWHIAETEAELTGLDACPVDITNIAKRTEWLAGRKMVAALASRAGLNYKGINKDGFGKPFLKDLKHHVSLSHSFPYVAAQLDVTNEVGIDIEQPKPKLLNIAPRIFSAVELNDAGDDLIKNCVYWCAKESLYKIYGQRRLTFIEHLSVEPFEKHEDGSLMGTISVDGQVLRYSLLYEVTIDYVLVRTKKKEDPVATPSF